MHVLLERDTRLHTDEIDMFRSCEYFEELLLTHSVERSPVRYATSNDFPKGKCSDDNGASCHCLCSVKVFDELDVPRIYDYVMTK